MKLEQLQQLESQMMEEVVKRRKLGGYSTEAEGLLLVCEHLLKLEQHLRNEAEMVEVMSAVTPKNKKARSA